MPLPAPLKKLAIRNVLPISRDRIFVHFHLRSADSQKPSTIAVWQRGDKKPFPSVKLAHYSDAECLLPDGRLLALRSDRPSSVLDGIAVSTLETPRVEDVEWNAASCHRDQLAVVGPWGTMRIRDAGGDWRDPLAGALGSERLTAVAGHPGGGFIVVGWNGLCAHVTADGVTKLSHDLGGCMFRAVACASDGTVVAATDGGVMRGPLDALAKVAHPSGKDCMDVVSHAETIYVSAEDGLYRVTGGGLEREPAPVASVRGRVRSADATLFVFDEDAIHARPDGGAWESLTA